MNFRRRSKISKTKKVVMIVSEFLIGGVGLSVGSGVTISALALVGLICVSSVSFLSSTSTLVTNEYISKLKIRYTKLRGMD